MATSAQVDALVALYAGYFNRAPDPAGLQFWIDQIDGGREFNTIAADFAASPEATALYPYLTAPDVATPSTFITSVYQNLFNRAPDAEGLQFWTDVLASGSVSVADMIEAIINGAVDAPNATPPTFDKTTLDNKVEVGLDFAVDAGNTTGFEFDAAAKSAAVAAIDGVTNDEATVVAAKAATDAYLSGEANEGDTFTLTTGADILVGTAANDTFNSLPINAEGAGSDTLSNFDSIDGGAGTDTLNIAVDRAGTFYNENFPANATVKNVEIVNINWVDNAPFGGTPSLLNVANYSGVEQLWQINASGNVTNATGDMTVGYRGNSSATMNDSITMATGETTANIALDNSVGSVDTNGATTVNVAGSKAAGTFTLNVNATGTATSVAVNTAVATTIATALSAVTTVDASASTGDITYTTSNDVSVSTGTGNDTVNVAGALAANATVSLGAGNDKLLAGAGAAVPSSATVDGGAGVDTVAASIINAANGSKFLNFENIDVSGATATPLDVELVTGSTITGLTLNGGAGGSTLNNVAAGVGLTVAGNNTGTTTIGVKGAAAGTADSFTTTFDGMAAVGATAAAPTTVAAGTVVTNGVEALNVVSGGTGFVTNTMAVTDNALQTLAITGDKDLALTFVGTNGTITGTAGGVSLIDGSAATGALNINTANLTVANAGLTVNTGAGKDVITLAQKATVDAGAGDDVITTSVDGGTLTGGAGADMFDIDASVATAGNLTEATGVFKTTINDFGAGDKIAFDAAGSAFVSDKVALGATVTNLDLALAAASNNAVTGQINWFQYGSDTYVVENVDGVAGVGAGDVVVKLAGSVDLSNSTYDATTDILSFA